MRVSRIPLFWYTIKYSTKMFFNFIAMRSKPAHDHKFYISYMFSKDRKPIYYKKDSKLKIFQFKGGPAVYKWLKLENPFIATYIRIHMINKHFEKLHFSLNFQGFKSVWHESDGYFIRSKTLNLTSGENHIQFKFDKKVLVSGIRFDDVNYVKEFAINYEINGKNFSYKDNVLQTEPAVLLNQMGIIHLRSFVADSLLLHNLEFTKIKLTEGHIVIHIIGKDDSLDSYHYPLIFHLNGKEKYNGEPVFSNLKSPYTPTDLWSSAKTNYFGPDCFTKPQYCENGFSVKFNVKGGLRQYSTFGYNVTDAIEMKFGNDLGKSGFGYSVNGTALASRFLFHMDHLFSFIKPFRFHIKARCMQCPSTSQIDGNFSIYILKRKSDFQSTTIQPLVIKGSRIKSSGSSANSDYLDAEINSAIEKHSNLIPYVLIEFIPKNINSNISYIVSSVQLSFSFSGKDFDIISEQQVGSGTGTTKRILTKPMVLTRLNMRTLVEGNVSLLTYYDDGYYNETYEVFKKESWIILRFPTVVKEYRLDGISMNNKHTHRIYGTGLFYTKTNQFSVMSIGFSAAREVLNNHGTGFTIYMKGQSLNVIVRTNTEQWHVTKEVEKVSFVYQTYVIVWDKQNLTIYEDGKLFVTSNQIVKTKLETIDRFLYLNFLKKYKFFMRTCMLDISNIRLWRHALNRSEDDHEFSNDFRYDVFDNSLLQSGFYVAPNCQCEFIYCPCKIDESKRFVSTVTDIRGRLYDSSSNVVQFADVLFSNYIMEDNGETFLMLTFPLNFDKRFVEISKIQLSIKYRDNQLEMPSIEKQCYINDEKLTMNRYNGNNLTVKLDQANLITTPISDNVTFKLSLKNCFANMNDNIIKAGVDIYYGMNLKETGFVIYADDVWQDVYKVFRINLKEHTRCLSFNYMFDGNGFSRVSIMNYLRQKGEAFEFKRLYLQGDTPKSGTINITVFHAFSSYINVVVVKNGNKNGYFMLSQISHQMTICKTLDYTSRITEVLCNANDQLNIRCPNEQLLHIKHMHYGRGYTGYEHPCDKRIYIYTPCSAKPEFYENITSACHNKRECSIMMDINKNLCHPNHAPYLHIDYQCHDEFSVTNYDDLKKRLQETKSLLPVALIQNINGDSKLMTQNKILDDNITKTLDAKPRIHWLPFFSYIYIKHSYVDYVIQSEKQFSDFTFSFWFNNNRESNIKISYSNNILFAIYGLTNSKIRLDGQLGNGEILSSITSNSWYHVAITGSEEKQKRSFYLNLQRQELTKDPQHFMPSKSNLGITFSDAKTYCIQMYDKILEYEDLIQTSTCPTLFSPSACGKTVLECARCNQYTGEIKMKKEMSQVWHPDCTHGVTKIYTKGHLTYFPMDFTINQTYVKDLFHEDFKFPFNLSIMENTNGMINKAVCFRNELYTIETRIFRCVSDRACFFGFWLKHSCQVNLKTLILQTSHFILKCSLNSFSSDVIKMEITTKATTVCFIGKSGFWYHLFFGIKTNFLVTETYLDGIPISFDQCDGEPFMESSNFVVGKDSKLCLDEFFVIAKGTVNVRSGLPDLFELYYNGIGSDLSEAKNHFLPYHFILDLKTEEWNTKMSNRFSIEYSQMSNKIENALSKLQLNANDFWINPKELMIYDHKDRGKGAFVEIYARKMNLSIFNELSKLSINSETNRFKLFPVSEKEDAMIALSDTIFHSSIEIIEVTSDKATIKYNLLEQHIKLPITSLYLACIEIESLVATSNIFQFALPQRVKQNYVVEISKDFLECRDLQPLTTYAVCILPIPITGTVVSLERCIEKTLFNTSGHGPTDAPNLIFKPVAKENETHIAVQQIDWGWNCFPGGYYVHYALAKYLDRFSADLLSMQETDLQKHFQNQSVPFDSVLPGETVGYLQLKLETYKNYTFLTYAFCEGNMITGKRNLFVNRSQPGAPESFPSNISIQMDRKVLNIRWSVSDDVDFWNSDKGSDWQVLIYRGNNFQEVEEHSVLYNESFIYNFRWKETYGIHQISTASKNKYGESKISDRQCFIYPLDDYLPRAKFVDETILNITNSSISLSFKLTELERFRGSKKYLFIGIFPEELEYTNKTIISYLKSTEEYDDNVELHPSFANETSGFRIYYKKIVFDVDVEDITGKFIECNETFHNIYMNQKIIVNLTLHDLQPFINYSTTILPCNELKCFSNFVNLEWQSSFLFQTKTYKPTMSPENLTILVNGLYANISWNDVPKSDRNGIILGYVIRLVKKLYNHKLSIFNETKQSVSLPIGKYVNFCVRVAAFTSYPDIGQFSQWICKTTEEFAPDILPNMQVIEATSSSFTLCFLKLLPFEMNGVLRHIIVNYKVTYSLPNNTTDNTATIIYAIYNHTVNQTIYTAKDNQTYCFKLINLTSFTTYQMRFKFVTIESGNWSEWHLNKTNIGVPSFSPNFVYNTSATSCVVHWEKLQQMFWNAPSIIYNITVEEIKLKQMVSFYELDQAYSTFEITGLKPYTMYNVSITACSSRACAFPQTKVFMTNESEPCAPSNIGVKKNTDIGIFINWTSIPEECENGVIIGYVIYVYELHDNESVVDKRRDFINETSDFNYLVTDVNFGIYYNISIAGQTMAGIGNKTEWLKLSRGKIIHGDWSEWTQWNICSKSCGMAYQERKRYCNNPAPFNGKNCSGNATEFKNCTLDPCPGLFLAGAEESCSSTCKRNGFECSKKLETEKLIEFMKCDIDPVHIFYSQPYHPLYDSKGNKCIGIHSLPKNINCNSTIPDNIKSFQRICNCEDSVEKYVTAWSSWTLCASKKCGFNIVKNRKRKCIANEKICTEAKLNKKLEQALPCGLEPCPINGGWSEWTPFSVCNRRCNGGNKTSYRSCDNPEPKYKGDECIGKDIKIQEECNIQACKIHGGWTLWTAFGVCHQPCDNSTKQRYRECANPVPAYGGLFCKGNDTESNLCVLPKCHELTFVITFHLHDIYYRFQFNYLHSKETNELQMILCREIMHIASNITFIKSCQIIRVRRGSVIADISLKFKYVNKEQLVQLSDVLNEQKMLGNYTLQSFQFFSYDLPCKPPTDIETTVVNKTAVFITWKLPVCEDMQNILYVYLAYTESFNTDKNLRWKIVGVHSKSKNQLLLTRLQPNVNYKAYMMQARKEGNGAPSYRFMFKTPSFPPSNYVTNINSVSISSTVVFISWTKIPKETENGVLSGYKIRYRKYYDDVILEKIIAATFSSTTIENLKPFTLYRFDVFAFNIAGNGPANSVNGKTLEGVPDIPVPDVRIKDMQSVDWWSVQWGELPKAHINGILRGYRLQYYLSYRSDRPIGGEIQRVVKLFDNSTFYYKAKQLLNYATYNVSVTGYTSAGNGPVEEHFARTCKCHEFLYGNWFNSPPYSTFHPRSRKSPMESNDELKGLFPSLILKMLIKACGKCKDYPHSNVFYYVTEDGDDPNRSNQYGLKISIKDSVDVSFPFYDRINRGILVPGSVFVPLVSTPGCAFIVRNEIDLNAIVLRLILAILNVWPLLIVSYAIATLFGIIIWFFDQFDNPDEFTPGSAIKGPCIGFWFSFITMTTVGYGDIAPRSVTARLLSIGWCLTGLVLNGIIIGFITTSLTSLDVPQQSSLYNTKVAALNESYELLYAIRRNANLSEKQYLAITDMLDDLVDGKVDVVLVDMYSMMNYTKQLDDRKLKLKSILETETGYGLVLSGFSYTLQYDIESLIYSENEIISDFTESMKDGLPSVWSEDEKSVSELVFGADSQLFQLSVIYMLITWSVLAVIGLFVDFIKFIRRRRKVVPKDAYNCLSEDLGGYVDEFFNDVTDQIESMSSKQQTELIHCAMYKHNVMRSYDKIGVDATLFKIKHLGNQAKKKKITTS